MSLVLIFAFTLAILGLILIAAAMLRFPDEVHMRVQFLFIKLEFHGRRQR